MSAGDIDDTIGSAYELQRLLVNFPRLRDLINQALPPINRDYTIPYGCGIATDASQVYFSPDIDCIVDGVDISEALATHEYTEWAIKRTAGLTYGHSHILANLCERRVVEDLGLTWARYSEVIDPQVLYDESEPIGPLPPDLATYPYDGELLQKVEEAMDA